VITCGGGGQCGTCAVEVRHAIVCAVRNRRDKHASDAVKNKALGALIDVQCYCCRFWRAVIC
jgi:ferredoxin